MAESSPNQGMADLHHFLDALLREFPEVALSESLLPRLAEQGLLEQALIQFKRRKPRTLAGDPWHAVRLWLETEVAKARNRRMHQWQLDPHRCTLRLRIEVRSPACDLHPPALQAALGLALLESGLPLAMGLEKTPRPAVHLGHPLPLGVEGLSEWADAVLRESTPMPLADLPECINPHCPAGLRVVEVAAVPNHASPVLDLSLEAHWSWACPETLQVLARERLALFESAESHLIEKTGKVGGHKQVKHVEVRPLVGPMEWEGDIFNFTTHISAGEALNPTRLLAGVLGVESSAIRNLTRLRVDLAEDPRLKSSDKYEPKLHNIFEDAVLLDGGSNVRVIDEDDDEPIRMNGPQTPDPNS